MAEEHMEQEDLHEVIRNNIHKKRFHLAESAPLCTGNLRGTFGYNGTCQISQEILDGTYDYPQDFDQATK
jgi:hypothetical protein